MTDRETRVQEIAYQLWVQEGRPEGRRDAHWYEAEAVYDAEVAGGDVKPNPPDDLALSETAVARAESSDGKAQKAGSRAKPIGASVRESRPANKNTEGEDQSTSSARAR